MEARREGQHWVLTGQKKWITGGTMAHWYVMATRTGGPGAKGISLILVPRDAPGLKVRKMETQAATLHATTVLTLDSVRVRGFRV